VERLRGFNHWFLSYTVRSRSPDPTRLTVPDRPGFVGAAPALPGVSRIKLRPASLDCFEAGTDQWTPARDYTTGHLRSLTR